MNEHLPDHRKLSGMTFPSPRRTSGLKRGRGRSSTAWRQARVATGVVIAGTLVFGTLQLDSAVTNPILPNKQQLQDILDKQAAAAKANVDRGALAADESAKRRGVDTRHLTGPLPAPSDAFERALPRSAAGTGALAAISKWGATVSALREIRDGNEKPILQFDYSNLGLTPHDTVEFLSADNNGLTLNARSMAPGVYRIDDPVGAAAVTVRLTYSGAVVKDTVSLSAGALARRQQ